MNKKTAEQKLLDAFADAVPDEIDRILKDCTPKQRGAAAIKAENRETKRRETGAARSRRFSAAAAIAAAAVLLLIGTIGGVILMKSNRPEPRAAGTVELKAEQASEGNPKDHAPGVSDPLPTPLPTAEAEEPRAAEAAEETSLDAERQESESPRSTPVPEALRIALEHAGADPNGTGAEIRRSEKNGTAVSSVRFRTETAAYEYIIREKDSAILEAEMESITEPESSLDRSPAEEQDAVRIAYKHAGTAEDSVVFSSVKRDRENGRSVYEIEFYAEGTEYEYDVDIMTGTVLSWSLKRSGTEQEDISFITEQEAKAIALADAGVSDSDAKKLHCELDTENGRTVYEVEFTANGREYEYDVDLLTGAILSREIEP